MRRRGSDEDSYDEVEEPDDFKFWPRDTAIDQTKQKLIQFFAEHPDGIYYDQQLRVLFEERPYKVFQWITGKALTELREERALKSELFVLGTGRPTLEAIGPGTPTLVRFFWSPRKRYVKRDANEIMKLVRQFSNQNFGKALGHQGEL